MDRARRLDVPNQSKSRKKAARERNKIKKSREAVDNPKKSIDAKPDSKPSDVLRKHIESLQEKSESSHSSDLPQEQLEKLIEAKKQEKVDFESAFTDLQKHIEIAKSRISEEVSKQAAAFQENPYIKNAIKEIVDKQGNSSRNTKDLKDLSQEVLQEEILEIIKKDSYSYKLFSNCVKDIINKQFTIIEEYHDIKELVSKDIDNIKEEKKFLLETNSTIYKLRNNFNEDQEIIKQLIKNDITYFDHCGIDLHAHLIKNHPESPEFMKMDNLKVYFGYHSSKSHIIKTGNKLILQKAVKYDENTVIRQFRHIACLRKAIANCQVFHSSSQKNSQEIRGAKLSSYDCCQEELNSLRDRSRITQDAKQKFETVIDQDDQAIHKAAYEETQQALQEYGGLALEILNQAYHKQLQGEKINKDEILKQFQDRHKKEEAFLQIIEETLQKNDNVKNLENEDKIIQKALDLAKDFVNSIDEIINNRYNKVTGNYRHAISFYNFVEKNITHRLPKSLDDLEKKCQEALRLFDEEIKELEWLHSRSQSELSDQPQVATEKLSSTDKLQTYLETAFEDPDTTPQRRHIVSSYLSSLFEKSHPQSLDDTAIAKFYKETIEEANQVGEYIEQKYFLSDKIRDEVIQLAVHLKHTFGFPLHQASIDTDFNIVKSRPSKKSSAETSKLEINPQGKILKDGIVQRVYLIGFQDSSQASSSDAQPKPMALLALQSTDPGYLKFGAGTPLPTGGVVDVVTAQYTTRDQPNLYKATLAIETLQETHEKIEIDMPTLELFETETVMHPHTKASLYDVTTFVGKVKDSQNQATSYDSKEYQETTGPCMVSLDELTSAVKQELGLADHFRPSQIVMQSLKRQIARQVLGKEKVPTSDQEWKKNGVICWADFHEYSTSMNMFAKYLVVAYREELGLAGSK